MQARVVSAALVFSLHNLFSRVVGVTPGAPAEKYCDFNEACISENMG